MLIKDFFVVADTQETILQCQGMIDMKLSVVALGALLLMPLVLAAGPRIESGTISFAGSIVEAGCAVERAGSMRSPEFRRLLVVPGVEVDVSTYQNACSHGAMPLSTTFEPFYARAIESSPGSGIGIVTVTYR
ncbi:hypothetical protein PS645_02369 [Pseudomonas fluorescens]|uniref:Type 1 fimbrial protein n=1 Tax=Pseudomonas fluorescens TaxID=294 RepID=A0A5E6SQ60_PSEFL|nr:type 1 fimbrial protein [Pseudomonas fluorescens]VVM82921.1 hypothetical protein PS645_02369 [Pseudomonas fluorescens]